MCSSSGEIVITLYKCSSHLPQSKEAFKFWLSEAFRGNTALLQHNRKPSQSPEWMVPTTNIHKKLMTGAVSSTVVGALIEFQSMFLSPFKEISYIPWLALQDSPCIGLRMPFHHPEHMLQIQHLFLTGRMTLPHKHSEAHGSSLSHGLRKLNKFRNSNSHVTGIEGSLTCKVLV